MALKLIHTADWHLGQTFFGYDREAEHEAFLGFLTNLLVERQTDVLLIAGDVFDVTNPSAGAQRRFYRFLREANRLNPGLQIVIIAGNHDSAIRLEAPNPLLEELNTSIVGIVGRTDSGEIDLASLVVPLRNRAGEREALCLAVPFLRQGDYPAAPEGEPDSYVAGIGRMYRQLYAYADARRNPGGAIVALGHLPATGAAAKERMRQVAEAARLDCDSVGGVVECAVTGLPAGLGGPLFGGVESLFSSILFGIPAVKGVEFGAGFGAALLRGSEDNDPFRITGNGEIRTGRNCAGGILGGMTTGMPLVFRLGIKPTSSIAKPQRSVNLETFREEELRVHGRHDPCVVPRAAPVAESCAAVAALELLLTNGALVPAARKGEEHA